MDVNWGNMASTTCPNVGIMQGRLLPPVNGAIQAFPQERWKEEFPLAQKAGLYCIEWIFDNEKKGENPLSTDQGVVDIRQLAEDCKVHVRSICADYYMTHRLVCPDGTIDKLTVDHLFWLINQIRNLGGEYVVLPFVDFSSLKTPIEVGGLERLINEIIPGVEKQGVEIHLETDLLPNVLAKIMDRVDHPLIRLNYDIGNSASLGYDPNTEVSLLGGHLGSVHVKDRLLGGSTVPLGEGNADLPTSFGLLHQAKFGRWFILQAARQKENEEMELTVKNRKLVERYCREATTYNSNSV